MTRKKHSYHHDATPPSYILLIIAFVIISVLAVARLMQTHWYTPKPASPIEERIEADQHVLLSISQQTLDEVRKYNASEQERLDLKAQLAEAQRDLKDLAARSMRSGVESRHTKVDGKATNAADDQVRNLLPCSSSSGIERRAVNLDVAGVIPVSKSRSSDRPSLSIIKTAAKLPHKASRALLHRRFGWGRGGDCWSTMDWDRGL